MHLARGKTAHPRVLQLLGRYLCKTTDDYEKHMITGVQSLLEKIANQKCLFGFTAWMRFRRQTHPLLACTTVLCHRI